MPVRGGGAGYRTTAGDIECQRGEIECERPYPSRTIGEMAQEARPANRDHAGYAGAPPMTNRIERGRSGPSQIVEEMPRDALPVRRGGADYRTAAGDIDTSVARSSANAPIPHGLLKRLRDRRCRQIAIARAMRGRHG